ncbi:hypothetical protein ECG_01282 [Echinococcus granulosus]|uniref:Proton_antipo_M domain-containing protein n=1 Tax=Echinococcus granulosus TaxID=6210 RepID=A0A068WDX0_ECHGR|nr:hypothetical protein ECG_01282 [Echinococcus granulosus]CDS15806.1 hypothetical protein EgrG_002017500 [Echinococcus granulosus]
MHSSSESLFILFDRSRGHPDLAIIALVFTIPAGLSLHPTLDPSIYLYSLAMFFNASITQKSTMLGADWSER